MSEPRSRSPARGGAWHPLLELTRVRALEFIREPEAIFWVFVFPVLLALALGIAFRTPTARVLRVAVPDSVPEHSRLVDLLSRAEGIEVEVVAADEAANGLRSGKVDVIVEGQLDPVDGNRPALTYRYDPVRPDGRAARLAVDDAIQRGLGRSDLATAEDQPLTEPGSRYIDFLIPGLIGLNLMGSGMWGLGFSLVVARTRNLLKRMAATPMRRSHFLLSYAVSRLVFLAPEVGVLVLFGWLVFDVEVRGSLLALLVVSVAGAVAFAALGLLVAARPRTIEAVSGWMNLVMLPMWLLSGTFFSYERFPEAVQPAIRALPLTALNDALRAVINDGRSLFSSWLELLVMAAWGGISFVVALRIFRWQ